MQVKGLHLDPLWIFDRMSRGLNVDPSSIYTFNPILLNIENNGL